MSDFKATPAKAQVTPAPPTETPDTPKGGIYTSLPFVVREVTQPGRAWTIVGTDLPAKRPRR